MPRYERPSVFAATSDEPEPAVYDRRGDEVSFSEIEPVGI
jgi:hypothetical protein